MFFAKQENFRFYSSLYFIALIKFKPATFVAIFARPAQCLSFTVHNTHLMGAIERKLNIKSSCYMSRLIKAPPFSFFLSLYIFCLFVLFS